MNKVLVTGGKGQLATCIKDVTSNFSEHNFVFKDSNEIDITNASQVEAFFEKEELHFCVNCAGYTNVDRAESEPEIAKKINVNGTHILAEVCAKHKVKLIHISTDFVFDGRTTSPYLEDDKTNPLGVYGRTKLDGELAVKKVLKEHYIVRTSWLYSEYGNNFVKTMLRLGDEKKKVKVVNDQVGAPTYAGDLAIAILQIIKKNTDKYGIYHFSNAGSISWFDFAARIFERGGLKGHLLPTTTAEYPTLAKRPGYSVLNTHKIENTFDLNIPKWQDSLEQCFKKLNIS